MKLVLAYIVARSYWQYYDSPWMESQWTSDSIHFLAESPIDEATSGGALYASKPYFAVEFDGKERGESMEYCDSYSVICRYPRLIGLCIMLVEIGRGQTLPIEDRGSYEANLNATWTFTRQLANRSKVWGDFDYPDYRKAIVGCLTYKPSTDDSNLVKTDVFARKAAIYDIVVQPLEKLLTVLGFFDNLHFLDPIDSSHGPAPVLEMPTAPALPAFNGASTASSQWLDRIMEINRFIQTRAKSSSIEPRRRVRVAVLDTGYDGNATFFNKARKARIQGKKDFVNDSNDPMDENGHGSHTLALVMKVAPTADVYVARIAKDNSALRNSTDAVAKVLSPLLP